MKRRTASVPLPRAEQEQPDVPTYRFWGFQKPPKNADVLCRATAVLSADSTKATIRLYGPIDSWGGFWGTSAKEVAEALDGLDDSVTEITLRVNSAGGSCFEGLAILNLLRAHPASVTAVVDGLAASAASFIVAGADERVMSPGTQLMVHDPWSSAWACNAAEMRKEAEVLDKIATSMADLYADVAGGTAAAWRDVMIEETWYTAKEAVEAGLADRVDVVPDAGTATTAGDAAPDLDSEDIEDRFDLSIYSHAGRSQAPAPKSPNTSVVGSSNTHGKEPVVTFSDEQLATMRTQLGVAEDADEATILAALSKALDERTEPGASTVPEGHVVVPSAKLKDLEAGAAAGVKAAKALHERDRKEFLDGVKSKFLPANRADWEAEYDRNPQATRDHFAKAQDILPTTELGHEIDTDTSGGAQSLDDVRESDVFKNWKGSI